MSNCIDQDLAVALKNFKDCVQNPGGLDRFWWNIKIRGPIEMELVSPGKELDGQASVVAFQDFPKG